jgi:hypothetical protein
MHSGIKKKKKKMGERNRGGWRKALGEARCKRIPHVHFGYFMEETGWN